MPIKKQSTHAEHADYLSAESIQWPQIVRPLIEFVEGVIGLRWSDVDVVDDCIQGDGWRCITLDVSDEYLRHYQSIIYLSPVQAGRFPPDLHIPF